MVLMSKDNESFEEKFPSLKGCRFTVDGTIHKVLYSSGKKGYLYRDLEIEENLLDKSKVFVALTRNTIETEIGAVPDISKIMKELRLE